MKQRELARDWIQMATDTMHSNDPKVHSGMREYNFRRIGHFLTYSWLNKNKHNYTEGYLYSLQILTFKDLMDKNNPFSYS